MNEAPCNFVEIDPREIQDNAIQMIGYDWFLVTAGTQSQFNTMTASWGGMGFMWRRPVMFVVIRPQRHTYELIEKEDGFTLSIFDESYKKALSYCGTHSGRDVDKVKETGLTPWMMESGLVAFQEARLVLECKKLYTDLIDHDRFLDPTIVPACYQDGTTHRMYVVEIVKAWKKS